MERLALSVMILLFLTPIGLARSGITKEEYSPLEDVAIDIPQNPEKYTWVLRDTINGEQISTNGAPIVRFFGQGPVIVSSAPAGTEIQLNKLMVYGNINYWPILYKDSKGNEVQGWVSGMFVERQ